MLKGKKAWKGLDACYFLIFTCFFSIVSQRFSTPFNRLAFWLCGIVPLQRQTTEGATPESWETRTMRNVCLSIIIHILKKERNKNMIEYSVYMMKSPMKPDEGPKAYAKNQIREVWNLDKFCKHIASHNSGYSRGLVKAILSDMCDCLVEQLLNGNKVKLGELGVFNLTISSEGAESLEKFSESNIKAVRINFYPGEGFENLLDRAEFKLVASRAAQAAVLKAEKANEKTVDLDAAKKKNDSTTENGENKPSGGGDESMN